MVLGMVPSVVLVDVAVDQVGVLRILIRRRMRIRRLWWGSVFYCVANMPVWCHTPTYALTNATMRYVVIIRGLEGACGSRDDLRRGLRLAWEVASACGRWVLCACV